MNQTIWWVRHVPAPQREGGIIGEAIVAAVPLWARMQAVRTELLEEYCSAI